MNPTVNSRRGSFILEIPVASSNFQYNSFPTRTARLWNLLPRALRESNSLAAFKSSLDNLDLEALIDP